MKGRFWKIARLLLLSVLLSACRMDAGLPRTSSGEPDPAGQEPLPAGALLLYDGSAFSFALVLSEHADSLLREEVIAMAQRLQELVQAAEPPAVREDYLSGGGTEAEILVGNTNRPVSEAAWSAVCTEFCFSVESGAECAVLLGSTDTQTRKAVRYFTDTYLPEHLYRNGDQVYLLPGSYRSSAESSTFISWAALNTRTGVPFSYHVQQVLSVPALGSYNIMQGACLSSNGDDAYFILRDTQDLCAMVKYDMRTGQLTASNENIGCDHGNDMCYNKTNGTVVVSHCTNNPTFLSVFRADTLELVERVNVGHSNSAVAYCAERGQYVIMGEGYFRILDEKFRVVQSFPHRASAHTSQGIHCDENYIYRVESKSANAAGNIIEVYDWSGNYVLKLELPEITQETETLFHLGSDLYVNCYAGSKKGGVLYRLTLNTSGNPSE